MSLFQNAANTLTTSLGAELQKALPDVTIDLNQIAQNALATALPQLAADEQSALSNLDALAAKLVPMIGAELETRISNVLKALLTGELLK